MIEFYTPSLLITEYYDSLISQLDIYTEERIKEIKEKGLPKMKKIHNYKLPRMNETYGVEAIKNPYESKEYTIDLANISNTNTISKLKYISQAEEYMNKVREKAIDEIRKVQDENLKHYKDNKEKFKVDRENLTEEKLEELKSQLFVNRYCFLVSKNPHKYWLIEVRKKNRYVPIFNLHTVIIDFYLRKSDIDYIRNEVEHNYKIENTTTFDQRFFLANQIKNYINRTLYRYLNGYEVIQIKEKTLFKIEHFEVISHLLRFNESDFLLDIDFDLSTIKSLRMHLDCAKIISDLSAFANIEYLCFYYIKLCQWPFQNLKNLIKLDIYSCDLSEFDFESLNSLTSLQIIDISTNISVAFKIDLSRLINLKWLALSFIISEVKENKFELITNSSNQLIKLCISNNKMDLSKQLDLPELKCLHISNSDFSQELSNQWFYGMPSLIELNLKYTNLRNVDFLDTDRLGNLELLSLCENRITVLRKGAFSKLNKLKKLDLRFNKIRELVPGAFEGLEFLEELDISLYSFRAKPIDKAVFDELNSLKYIYHYR